MSLQITAHAKQRAAQRFDLGSMKPTTWLKKQWARARFVANIVGEDGHPARMFAAGSVVLVVDQSADRIITVYKSTDNELVKNAVRAAAFRVLEKVQRQSKRQQRQLERLRAAIEIELGQRRLELMRARSQTKRLALQARIAALEERLAEMPAELIEAKRSVNSVAKGVARYV